MARKTIDEQREAHIQENARDYAKEIEAAAANSTIYESMPEHIPGPGAEWEYMQADSVSAAISQDQRKRIAILNFADYTRRGGLYLYGSNAQEEALCSESILYNILNHSAFDSYFAYNSAKENQNCGLYQDRALFTPDVVFCRNDTLYRFSVVTCAAANRSANRWGKYERSPKASEHNAAMEQRIKFIRNICENQHVDILIAGRFGCGVFGQPKTYVQEWFRNSCDGSSLEKIVFAVP